MNLIFWDKMKDVIVNYNLVYIIGQIYYYIIQVVAVHYLICNVKIQAIQYI